MKFTAYVLSVLICSLSSLLYADEPGDARVKVYCFSSDLEAGFKDEKASFFCKELGKDGKEDLVLVENKKEAHASVQYLGSEQMRVPGETTHLIGGYAWTPDQLKNGVRTVLSIDDFTKGFHGEGIGAAGVYRVLGSIEAWIRDNKEAILAKAKKE